MKRFILNLLTGMVLLGLTACYYDNPPGDVPIVIENVSFNRDVLPIFLGSCLGEGCHAGDHEPTLTADEAYSSLTEGTNGSGELFVNLTVPDESPVYLELKSGSMPPTGALGTIEVEFIRAWITKGAFND